MADLVHEARTVREAHGPPRGVDLATVEKEKSQRAKQPGVAADRILNLSLSGSLDTVKQHGGGIDVETEPGVFAEFIITLPRDSGSVTCQKPE